MYVLATQLVKYFGTAPAVTVVFVCANSSTPAGSVTDTLEVREPWRSAELGSAACTAKFIATAAGDGAEVEVESGRISKRTMTEPGWMSVTLIRVGEIFAALATSLVKVALKSATFVGEDVTSSKLASIVATTGTG